MPDTTLRFRPKQLKTLGELIDWANHMVTTGVAPTTPLYVEPRDGGLDKPTMLYYGEDGASDAFVTLEYWDDDALARNAAHCDNLGLPRE